MIISRFPRGGCGGDPSRPPRPPPPEANSACVRPPGGRRRQERGGGAPPEPRRRRRRGRILLRGRPRLDLRGLGLAPDVLVLAVLNERKVMMMPSKFLPSPDAGVQFGGRKIFCVGNSRRCAELKRLPKMTQVRTQKVNNTPANGRDMSTNNKARRLFGHFRALNWPDFLLGGKSFFQIVFFRIGEIGGTSDYTLQLSGFLPTPSSIRCTIDRLSRAPPPKKSLAAYIRKMCIMGLHLLLGTL